MPVTLQTEGLNCVLGGRTVLEQVRLEARPNEVLALIGPNGAGKTTLLRALARLLRPAAGRVLLDGAALAGFSPRALARQLALAPQSSGENWPLTVEQVVSLGRAPHRGWLLPLGADDQAAVLAALERTGLLGLRERPVTEISGGEQRRVILARALAQQPQALLLDEPTAALDLKYQVAILQLARLLAHRDGITVIMTLHDLNQAAEVADRVVLLAQGRVLASGTPATVLTPALLEQAYEVPVAVSRHPLSGAPLVTALIPHLTNDEPEYNERRS